MMDVDCLVVGGGAAGAVAATYLARFKRDVLVVDAGQSRLLRIPLSHNAPGYGDGIEGKALHARLRDQALRYGVRFDTAGVREVKRLSRDAGFEIELGEGACIKARAVLIATGIVVTESPIDDVEACVRAGLIRYCPICDGFEVQNKTLIVLGGHPHSIDEARFLTTYSASVSYLPAGPAAELDEKGRRAAEAIGIRVLDYRPFELVRRGDKVSVQRGGQEEMFDTLYPCLGVHPNTACVSGLRLKTDSRGAICTDKHQATPISGLFAAGDVTDAIDQIATAFGQAAIAATSMHNFLRDAEAISA